MRQLNDMDGRNATLPQVARPVVVEVFVKEAVLDVVREEILHFNGSTKLERQARVMSTAGILFVVRGVALKSEGCLLGVL